MLFLELPEDTMPILIPFDYCPRLCPRTHLVARVDEPLHGTEEGAVGAHCDDHLVQGVDVSLHDRREGVGQGFH